MATRILSVTRGPSGVWRIRTEDRNVYATKNGWLVEFVLVTKLVAVLNARSGVTFPAPKLWGLKGKRPCSRCSRYVSRKPNRLKLSSAAV